MTPLAWAFAGLAAAALALAGYVGVRWRRDRAALRAAHTARASAVDAQRRTAELAVAAERMRIVREMHDILAHSLAIMIAQADGGSYVAGDAAARRAFLTIAETGRGALADTRRVLGVLRADPQEAPELSPLPDDASVDALVERALAAGLAVSLVRLGQPRPMPGGARMARYRICQEALTNVLKHGGEGARVVVTENWRAAEVVLTVTNQGGRGAPRIDDDPLGGHGLGLIGMRERAEIVGGRLDASPIDDGFQVRARLPYTDPDAEPAHEPAAAPAGWGA